MEQPPKESKPENIDDEIEQFLEKLDGYKDLLLNLRDEELSKRLGLEFHIGKKTARRARTYGDKQKAKINILKFLGLLDRIRNGEINIDAESEKIKDELQKLISEAEAVLARRKEAKEL